MNTMRKRRDSSKAGEQSHVRHEIEINKLVVKRERADERQERQRDTLGKM